MKVLVNAREWILEHKWLVFKLIFGLCVVFAVLQVQTYSGRLSAQYIHRAIYHGLIQRICVAHSSNIGDDTNGVFVRINKRKYYIEEKWAGTKPKRDLYLAIVFRKNGNQRSVLINSANARRFLNAQNPEGCRRFRRRSVMMQGGKYNFYGGLWINDPSIYT